jgi:hypothetical protein
MSINVEVERGRRYRDYMATKKSNHGQEPASVLKPIIPAFVPQGPLNRGKGQPI